MKRNILIFLITSLLITNVGYAETKVIRQGNPEIKEMALTFDDGYSEEKIRSIASKLNEYNVKGTFFFVGSYIASNKEIVRELEADGHLVVSHSFSHPDFTKLTEKGIVGEMENTKIAYNKATDKTMEPYFRPPYGAYNDKVLNILGSKHDLYVIMWSIDTLDWKGLDAKTISNTVLDQAGNGKIVLMHTTQHVNTDKALDDIINGLHNKGFNLVRIDEMVSKLPDNERISSIQYHGGESGDASGGSSGGNGKSGSDNSGSSDNIKPNSPYQGNPYEKNRIHYLYRLYASRGR